MPLGQRTARELTIGELLEMTFDLYQRDFAKYVGLFIVVGVITGILNAYVRQAFVITMLQPNSTPQQVSAWFSSFISSVIPLLLGIALVTILFFPIAQGTTIKLASERIEKGQARLGSSISFVLSKLLWIWALSIIVGFIVIIGILALIVPGIILAIMFSLAFPVLIIENTGVGESMGRSRTLVSHRWGKTFVAYLILELIVLVASAIVGLISAPFGFLGPVVSGILSAFYAPLFAILLTVHYYSNVARLTPPAMDSMPAGPGPAIQSGMKYCVSCGQMMASNAIFCPRCGTTQPA